MATEAEAFSWSCTMPEKKASSFDRRRPQATLEADGMGKRKIPVEVARALKKAEADRSSGYMSADELLEAEGQIEEQYAWQKTAEILNKRDCTVSELTERLAERGYGRPAIDSALAIAQKKHLVDDRRYAKRFCEQKIRAGWGRRKIELELARRGVALGEDIGWSEAAGDEDEAATSTRSLYAILRAEATASSSRRVPQSRRLPRGAAQKISELPSTKKEELVTLRTFDSIRCRTYD